jgi:hypothetical protein
MSILNWVMFLKTVMPDLVAIARELFQRHRGNVEAAQAELKTITDYGAMRRDKQAAIDREIADWRADQARKGGRP